jgi:hypothetical protein
MMSDLEPARGYLKFAHAWFRMETGRDESTWET